MSMTVQQPTYKCTDCNGTGKRLEFVGIFNGVCFTCNGSGVLKTDAKASRPVVIKQHSRTLSNGTGLEFLFWNTGLIQVFKRDEYGDTMGVRSVTLEQAREIYKNPAQF